MQSTSDQNLPLFLREKPLLNKVLPVARSTLWDWVASGLFPEPVRLSPGAVAWRREDVLAWVNSRKPISRTDFQNIQKSKVSTVMEPTLKKEVPHGS